MPSSRETNTMEEGLRKIMSQISTMKAMPDSDLAFLVDLETNIVSYLRNPTPAEAPGPGGVPSPADAGMGAMAPAMGQVMGGGPMPGMSPGMPNPDELRRVVTPA